MLCSFVTHVCSVRLLRVFKLYKFIDKARKLGQLLLGSARTIGVFLFFIFWLQVVLGYSIFVIESSRPGSQFQTVTSGVYWTILTMTTVGHRDVLPQIELGRMPASVAMLLGLGIIAIPTGILMVWGVRHHQQWSLEVVHGSCGRQGYRRDARHCDGCGASMPSRA